MEGRPARPDRVAAFRVVGGLDNRSKQRVGSQDGGFLALGLRQTICRCDNWRRFTFSRRDDLRPAVIFTAILALVGAPTAFVSAQDTDFSGSWTLDRDASDIPQGRGGRTEPAALGVSTGEARPRGFGLSPRRRRPRSRARNGVRRRRSATPSAPGVTWTRKTTFSAPRRARGSGSRVSIDFDRGHDARARAARRRRRTSVDLIFYTWGPPRRVRRRKPRPL